MKTHNSPKDTKQTGTKEYGERLLAKKLFWSKLAIFFEQLWVKLWAPFIIVSFFIIASLYELWPHLSPLFHRLTLALFLFALIASLYPLLSLRWTKESEALKRLDKNSTLPHQPAQAFKDNLSPDLAKTETRTLWMQFKQRLVEKIKQLKVRPPRPNTAEKDPYALRIGVILAMALGLFIQGGQFKELLSKGLTLPPMLDTASLRIDAWVTPPSYTEEPPILIANGAQANENSKRRTNAQTTSKNRAGTEQKNHYNIPENAILTIRINGNNAERIELEAGNNPLEKTQMRKKNAPQNELNSKITKSTRDFQVRMKSTSTVNLTINKIPLKSWKFTIKQDQPPIIGLIESPNRAQSGALKLKYRVADDYGVMSAKAHITNVTSLNKQQTKKFNANDRPLGTPPEYPLNLTEIGTKAGEAETFKDLTRHPWAGLIATLHLSATDEGGNTSKSPELQLKIPEYNFTKPLAKKIISIRKKLILKPQESALAARNLYTLTISKENFENDLSLYLGVRLTANKLRSAQSRKEKETIAEILYELARKAEDGEISRLEKELRAAQDALRKALQGNASSKEIQKRIDELRKALQNYMQALAQQQQNQNANNNKQNKQKNNNNVNPQDFEQMLKTIEELAKSGSKDLARQMLSQMQNMLENLQTQKSQNNQSQTQASKDLEALSKMLRKQQELMDKTFEKRRQDQQNRTRNRQQQQQGQQSQQNKQQTGRKADQQSQSLSQEQQALGKQIQKLMRDMQARSGQTNQSLKNAGRAMGRAAEMLKRQDLDNALSEEAQALDQLQKGINQLGQQMGQAQNGKGGGNKRNGRDPLGRQNGQTGQDTSESTKVPQKIDIQRAREILRDLQDKVGDPNRPAPELDYYERLLKRF